MGFSEVHPAPAAATSASRPAAENAAAHESAPAQGASRQEAGAPPRDPPPGLLRRAGRALAAALDRLFGAVSLSLLLSITVTVPIVQFFALGYVLRAAARVARTGRLREAFAGVREASRVGQSALALWLLAAPSRLLLSLRDDALLLDPGGATARRLGVGAVVAGAVAALIGLVGLLQGGRIGDFARPIRGLRRLAAARRDGGLAGRTWGRLRDFVGAFAVPTCFWLGVRGYLGAGAWLIVPSTLLAFARVGPLPLLGGALLAAVVVRVPFLQIHFAVHDDIRKMFDARGEMALFRRAPLAFLLALAATLLLSLPLYLLKIEIVPRDALWLPAIIFLVTIFPVKILSAFAYHRAARRPEPAHPLWQWPSRILMAPIALFHSVIVFLTPLTGWHGLLGLYEHHAFLLPAPF